MQAQIDRQISRYAVDDARPATFLERGVTIPFTTPILLGSRVRPSERRGLEIAVPSPGGVRGFYVLPLKALGDICNPTLHDRLVIEMIEETAVITPEAILRVTRAVAQEGLAGRAAAAAAEAAEREAAGRRMVTNFRFLLLLIRQTEGPGEHPLPPERDAPANVQRRAESAVARIAAEAGLPPPSVVNALEELAGAYLPVGFRGDPTGARYQGELAELEAMVAEVTAWGETAMDTQQAGSAFLVARSAALTLGAGRVLLEEVLGLTDDLRRRLRRWSSDSGSVSRQLARLAWLLDGWSVMIGLWRLAESVGRSVAIREMAVMVPTMPQEVSQWTGDPEDERYVAAHKLRSRSVFRLEDWRTGRMLDLIARNELIVRDLV
jgi:hypothetical protein